jgi:hypothetical protein
MSRVSSWRRSLRVAHAQFTVAAVLVLVLIALLALRGFRP